MFAVKTLHARVVKGRYVIDEPSTLPEGTVVELVIAEPESVDIGGPEYTELRGVLKQSHAELRAGLGHSLEELVQSRKVVSRGRKR